MTRHFDDLDQLIAALPAEMPAEASLTAKVATTTSPGGEQIAFRGRIVVEVQLAKGEVGAYVEQVMPYIATTKSPETPARGEGAADMRSAQLALARQLRSYRGEYQAVVDAARTKLAAKLAKAGVKIIEPDD